MEYYGLAHPKQLKETHIEIHVLLLHKKGRYKAGLQQFSPLECKIMDGA